MPFVSLRAKAPISAETMDMLQKEIGRLITIIPGKTIDNCMTQIEGGAHIFMSGGPKEAVFCEVRLFTPAPKDKKAELTAALHALFVKTLGIDTSYINYLEMEEWGSNGRLSG